MVNNRHALASILGNFKELKEVLDKTSDSSLILNIFQSLPTDPFYSDASQTQVSQLYLEIIRNPRTSKEILLQIIRNVQSNEKEEVWQIVNSILELKPKFTEEEQAELASILQSQHLVNLIPILTNKQVISDICKLLTDREIFDISIWATMVRYNQETNWIEGEFTFVDKFLKRNNARQLSGQDLMEPFLRNKITPGAILTICLDFELAQEYPYIHNLTKIVKHPNLLDSDKDKINNHFSKDPEELNLLLDLADPD